MNKKSETCSSDGLASSTSVTQRVHIACVCRQPKFSREDSKNNLPEQRTRNKNYNMYGSLPESEEKRSERARSFREDWRYSESKITLPSYIGLPNKAGTFTASTAPGKPTNGVENEKTGLLSNSDSSSSESSAQSNSAHNNNNNHNNNGHPRGRVSAALEGNEVLTFEPVTLAFKDLTYKVPMNRRSLSVLKEVSGFVEPGECLAIIGPEGAGKTTLLNILALRLPHRNSRALQGTILINGEEVDYINRSLLSRIPGFVPKEEAFLGDLTVTETLEYVAEFRMSRSVTEEEKMRRISTAIKKLGLESVRFAKIGTPESRGISPNERRRVAIAIELICSSPIIFLDEPTAGLDSASETSVMETLLQLRQYQHTVVFSVTHVKPSIFFQFDKVMLMSHGQVIYFGASRDVVKYFTSLGYIIPIRENPVDFFTDILSAEVTDLAKINQVEDLAHSFTKSEQCEYLNEQLHNLRKSHRQSYQLASPTMGSSWVPHSLVSDLSQEFGIDPVSLKRPSGFHQFWVLLKRTIVVRFRNPRGFWAHMGAAFVLALVCGFAVFRIETDEEDVVERINAVYLLLLYTGLMGLEFVTYYVRTKHFFLHEKAASLYGVVPYVFATTLSSLAVTCLRTLLYTSLFLMLTNLRIEFNYFLYYYLTILSLATAYESLYLLISCAAERLALVTGLSSTLLILSVCLSGFSVPLDRIADEWLWYYWINPFQYAFTGLLINEFKDRTFHCDDPNNCPYPDGAAVLDYYGIEHRDKWESLWGIFVIVVSCRFATVMSLKFLTRKLN